MLTNLKTQIQPPVGIIGLGKSGLSAKKLLELSGYTQSEIICFDENYRPTARQAEVPSLNQNSAEGELSCITSVDEFLAQTPFIKTAIISPGFPLESALVKALQAKGVAITSEVNLACYFLENEKIIGITGSLGKSTTTSLVGAGLKAIDSYAFVGGNLGTPFCDYAINLIQNHFQTRAQWVVLELSSYHLENSSNLKLDMAAITYLTPNHLERYLNLDHYYETKWTIFNHLKVKNSFGFLNRHGGELWDYVSSNKLAEIIPNSKQNLFWSDPNDIELKEFSLTKATILGKHNQDNLALAAHILLKTGSKEKATTAINAMKFFSGLNHRLEVVEKNSDLLVVNDSKATTIDSVITAIRSCLEETQYQRILLLLGGKDKQLPWSQLKEVLPHSKIKIFYFGYSGQNIKSTLGIDGLYYEKLNLLLADLKNHIQKKDIILFSPGGTSHDEFKNFEERGDFFKKYLVCN